MRPPWRQDPRRARPAVDAVVRAAVLAEVDLPGPADRQPPWPPRVEVIDGCDVLVRTSGRRGAGEPAVFVHGLGGDSSNWTDLMAALAPWLYGQALDLPGFGGSGPPRGGDYSLGRHARVAVRLIERIGEPVHLFGNSLGGAASVLIAARRPDLVRTLTLVSPAMPDLRPRRGAAAPMQVLLLPGAVALADRYLARFTPEQRVRAIVDACFGDPAAVPDYRLAEAAEELRRRSGLPWRTEALVRSLRGLVAAWLAVGPRSLWACARQVTAPTLVVWGDRDRLVDVALAPRTAQAIPGARLLVLPGRGHVAQLEDPLTVARAFLALRDDAGRPVPDLPGSDGPVSDEPVSDLRGGCPPEGTECERLPR